MFVRADTEVDRSELCEVEDLQRLHVELVGPGDRAGDAVARALAPFGRLDGDHAWLSADALRAAGPDDPDWQRRFDAMIDYARSKGWTDDTGAVRAHIEA